MSDEALYHVAPEFQTEAIIKGFGYWLPSVPPARAPLATGELRLEDEVCPDCGCIYTSHMLSNSPQGERLLYFLSSATELCPLTNEVNC